MTGLRVGLVCPYSFDAPGGVQNHVLGLARYLRTRGHDPAILAPGEMPTSEDLHDVFTSAGTAVPVRYNGSVARVNFGPLSAARVGRWLRRGDFDLVHLHEPVTPSVSVLSLWQAETPVVATFHTATPRSRSMQLARGALRPAIEKISAGIAVSESARQVVVQHLGRDAVVIPNGFDFASFADAPAGRGPRPRIAYVGRLDEPRKGLDVLLAALPAIRRAVPEVEVMVAGLGSRALPAGCRALGSVSEGDKIALLASADVFVAPHRARESFGIVVLEAMASGTRVVASELDAFSDLLTEDGRSLGRQFATGDPSALAAAVVEALDDHDLTTVAAARDKARRYDWSVVGREVVEVYQAALAAAPQASVGLRRRAGAS